MKHITKDRRYLTIVAVATVIAGIFVVATVEAAPPQPIDATLTGTTVALGFIFSNEEELITRNRVYTGIVEGDITGTFLLIEDSECELPCSLPDLKGENEGTFVIYITDGSGNIVKVIEGKFEGKLLPGGNLEGRWQITRVAGGLFGSLIHGHGSGEYTGSITGAGGFTITITGRADI